MNLLVRNEKMNELDVAAFIVALEKFGRAMQDLGRAMLEAKLAVDRAVVVGLNKISADFCSSTK